MALFGFLSDTSTPKSKRPQRDKSLHNVRVSVGQRWWRDSVAERPRHTSPSHSLGGSVKGYRTEDTHRLRADLVGRVTPSGEPILVDVVVSPSTDPQLHRLPDNLFVP